MATKQKYRKSNPNALPSILSISMVLLMLGLFLMVALSAKKLSDYLRENVAVTAFIHSEAEESEILKLKAKLEQRADVKQLNYTDKETAAREFSQELGQDFVNTLGFNPIPGSFEILLKSENASQTAMANLKQDLSHEEIIREVVYQTGLLERIEKNAKIILTVIIGLSLVFLLIAITLINSTIRLDLYSRRFLIRSMQLVGATRWFIIRPFIWKMTINGFLGWLLTMFMLGGLFYLFFTYIEGAAEIITYMEMAIGTAIIFAFGIILTMICSFFATQKYLKLKLEELY